MAAWEKAVLKIKLALKMMGFGGSCTQELSFILQNTQ